MGEIDRRHSCCDDIVRMVEIIGSGPTGIESRIRDLEDFYNKIKGGFAILVFIGAVNLITLVKMFIHK